jgi:iron complex outermembrane receptor protein
VAKGFSSVLYGPNTLGGAINLVTKRPSEKFQGNAILGAKDGDGKKVAVNVGSAQDLYYVQVGGSFRDQGDFKMSSKFVPTTREDGDRRGNSDFTDTKVSAKFGFVPSSNSEYVLGYTYQTGEKGAPQGTQAPGSSRTWRWPVWGKDTVYFLSTTGIGDHSYVKARAYHDAHKNELNIYADATYTTLGSGNPISLYDDFTDGGIVEFGTTYFKNHSLRAVAQIRWEAHRGQDLNAERVPSAPWSHLRDEFFSFGVEDSVTVNDKLDITAGAALDRQKGVETGVWENKDPNTFVQGQFGVFYKATDKIQTYVTAARKSRFASLSDRFSQRFDRYVENPDLKAEESMNYDIGAKAAVFKWLSVEGAVFYSDITNLIQEVPNFQDNLSQMQNVGKVKHQGIELSFYLKPATWLDTGIFYTYMDKQNISDPGTKITRVPKNRVTGFVKVAPIQQCYFMASLESQNGAWENNNTVPSGYSSLGGYTVLNATVGYMPTKAITIDGGFTNVLDRDYQQSIAYPLPGRTWFVNGKYKF